MTERTNYVNKRLGKLLVLAELPDHVTPNGSHQRMVRVKCVCGNVYDTRLATAKKSKICRDCQNKLKWQKNDQAFIGKRFGKLVVIKRASDYISPSGNHLKQFKCKCDCGNITVVTKAALVTGGTKSCGCLANTAGLLKDYSELMKKYDFERNKGLNLDTLTARSSKKVWWKCPKCGNSWLATIASQNDKIKHGCPYCSGRLVVKGKNDLLSQYPDIVKKYWDYDRNKIKPDEVASQSGQKVWWHCPVGHKWKATVSNKVKGSGCPTCNIENVNSFCEQAFYFYVKKAFPDAVNSDQHIGMELDVYIPSKKTGIEYDGQPWHKTKHKYELDLKKNKLCLDKGITLIRIREPKLKEMNNCIVFNRKDTETNRSLDEVIIKTLKCLKAPIIDVDTTRDESKILSQYAQKKYENSLTYLYPNVAKEWDYDKNGKLTPDKVNKRSRFKVWWKCKYGHEWQMKIGDRTRKPYKGKNGRIRKPQGCPYCSGKRVWSGFNDLKTKHPEIAALWDYDKNGDLLPINVSSGSSRKKIWWKCSYGHEYQRSVEKECAHKGRCPICWKKRKQPSVVCEETNQVFKNGSLAAQIVNMKTSSSIYKCCRGQQKTAGCYHWRYAD